MRLCKTSKNKLVHAVKYRPPLDERGKISYPGQEGPICDESLNFFSSITFFESNQKDISCQKCLQKS
jgi:hypothetical protein